MTDADDELFGALLATMFDVFDRPLRPAVVALYYDALAEFPLDVVTDAIRGTCRDAMHFHRLPRPGDLRVRCGAPTIEMLIAQLDRALADGYFAPPDDTAPIVRQLIRRLGGWKFITEQLDAETLRRRVYQIGPSLLASQPIGAPVRPIPLPTLKAIS
jgi:hypothetical protein